MRLRPRNVLAAAASALVLLAPAASSAAPFGPFAPRNPYTAANGAATMHGDSESSDASPYPGPDAASEHVDVDELAAACPTILQGSDGMPVALCTKISDRAPAVYLLDPSTGATLASLDLPAGGNLFGGVYAYLDQDNRMVLFTADGDLVRIAHARGENGHWGLAVVSSISVARPLDRLCADLCGGVVGLAPDFEGRVWFATLDGVAGFVTRSGAVRTIRLGRGETVDNSISTAPGRTAIATDHALYLLDTKHGRPHIVWRYAYDRGPSRKPGQLSWGTGSTPTFFGPGNGSRYLAITDNAAPAEHLLVFDTQTRQRQRQRQRERGERSRRARSRLRTATRPRLACKIAVLTPGPSGTENAPVGSGRSVFIASTYGYPYPASPAGAPPAKPASAPFTGGMTRVDLARRGNGCHVVWQNDVRSAAVPRLDVPDRLLYTVERIDALDPAGTSDADRYASVAINTATGKVVGSTTIGVGYAFDTLQLSPTIVPGRVMYQGTITGILRLSSGS